MTHTQLIIGTIKNSQRYSSLFEFQKMTEFFFANDAITPSTGAFNRDPLFLPFLKAAAI